MKDLYMMKESNLKMKDQLREESPFPWIQYVTSCYQCQKCTSGCTSMKHLELKPHEVVKLVNMGLIDELLESETIWTCTECLKCWERCPQGAAPVNLILSLRNLAVKGKAKPPENLLKTVSSLIEIGLIQREQRVPLKNLETVDREKLNLPKLVYPSEEFKGILLSTLEEVF